MIRTEMFTEETKQLLIDHLAQELVDDYVQHKSGITQIIFSMLIEGVKPMKDWTWDEVRREIMGQNPTIKGAKEIDNHIAQVINGSKGGNK